MFDEFIINIKKFEREEYIMWEELGISCVTAIIILIALYFIIKWGVKNGIKQYFEEKAQEEKMKQQLDEYHTEKNKKK